jgi:hypothetical protein
MNIFRLEFTRFSFSLKGRVAMVNNKTSSQYGIFGRLHIMKIAKSVAWMLVILLCVGAPVAWGHGEEDTPQGAPPERLGEVNFPVSCNPAAQKELNRAMALFHSFWFEPAKKSFAKVLEHDPGCGMAHWGIAVMSMGNPFGWPPNPNALKAAAAAVAEAHKLKPA